MHPSSRNVRTSEDLQKMLRRNQRSSRLPEGEHPLAPRIFGIAAALNQMNWNHEE
ncbi:MAG TPA: hypothetical protein PK364_07640 [Synergistaceae bacterium]|nr:hypothetical protein [Synergistaceae bacterium]HPJ25982.1 hypothetical protein [Synergistaceae bacterium]HPQ37188.1 hypothetical protein [Synergistaceae bacterium]